MSVFALYFPDLVVTSINANFLGGTLWFLPYRWYLLSIRDTVPSTLTNAGFLSSCLLMKLSRNILQVAVSRISILSNKSARAVLNGLSPMQAINMQKPVKMILGVLLPIAMAS